MTLSQFKWFEIMDQLFGEIGDKEQEKKICEKCFVTMIELDLSPEQESLLRQSYMTFSLDASSTFYQRKADALIVSDSESLDSPQFQDLVIKRKQSIKRRARYLQSKLLAERNYLESKLVR